MENNSNQKPNPSTEGNKADEKNKSGTPGQPANKPADDAEAKKSEAK